MNSVLVLWFSLFFVSASAEGTKFCVVGSNTKCNNLVNITCITGDNSKDCVKKVVDGDADLALATADDMVAYKDKVKIVLTEKYAIVPDFVRYYAVAVVKKNSSLKFTELKGKKTCHTGAGKTAGWKIPVGYLLWKEIMPFNKDQYQSAANFFSASCVPGVKGKTEDTKITGKLCELCKDKECSSNNAYAGYDGAYYCMTNGSGQVAFVKQSTPIGKENESDYELLCTDGKKKAITDFKDCNIGTRPAGAIVTAQADKVDSYRMVLNGSSLTELKAAISLDESVVSLEEYDDTTIIYLGDYAKFITAVNKKDTSGATPVASTLLLQLIAAFLYFVL